MIKPPECEKCSLLNAPGPVWGSGDPKRARLIYIAQNPASVEWETKIPLTGPTGNVYNRQLFEAGIPRNELYVTNQVKCLTPGNRAPTPHEVACCKHLLQKELDLCKSDTVVLAGQVAFSANIGTYSTLSPGYRPTDNIIQRMGCVEQKDGRKWIGTIHPAFIMRMPMFREAPIAHLKKAWAIAGLPIAKPKVHTQVDEEYARQMIREARARREFADDVETQQKWETGVEEDDYVGGDWKVDMCGFSVLPYEAFILTADQIYWWEEVFADPLVMQFEHNGEYDRFYLEQICPQENFRVDTMLAHHWLHSNTRKALKPNLIAWYTNLPYYDRKLEQFDRKLYCGMDNITTRHAGIEIVKQLKSWANPYANEMPMWPTLWELFLHFGMPKLPIHEMWRRRGLRVDVPRAFLYKRITAAKLEQAEQLIEEMLGPFFNWKSPKQVAELFYKKWGLPEQYRKRKDKNSGRDKMTLTTDDDAREELRRWIKVGGEDRKKQYKQASIYFDLADFASEQKKLGEYFDRISPDGKIHTHWKATGTETFRDSSTPNIQNWPTWAIMEGEGSPRSVVLPDDDECLLISTDFSAFQLWLYAVQFNIKYLLEIFKTGAYLYGPVYEDIFKRPFFKPGLPPIKENRADYVTDLELLRAKAIPLGFLFDRSGESIAVEHGWPPEEGRRYKKDWFAKVPELPAAHARIKFEMAQKGFLRPPPGLLLHYPQPSLQGLNCFAQTPEAMMVSESYILLEKEFKRREFPKTRTILSVHDSITVNVHRQFVQEVYETCIKPILERAVPWLKNFRFRHEAKVGYRWDWEMKAYNKWLATTDIPQIRNWNDK